MDIKSEKKIFLIENNNIYQYIDLIGNVNLVKSKLIQEKNQFSKNHSFLFQYNSWFSFAVFYIAAKELNITVEPTQENLNVSNKILLKSNGEEIKYLKKEYRNFCNNFEPGFIINSSGTTGKPKKIYLSYLRLNNSCLSIKKYMKTSYDDFHAWSMPPDYVYGLSMLNQVINSNSSVYIIDPIKNIKEIMDKLRQYKVNKLYGVPSGIKMIMKYGFNLISDYLKTIFIAGGRCDKNLAELISQRGIKVCVMYGCTEASARLTYIFDDINEIGKGCVGIPIDGVDIKILDNSMQNRLAIEENITGDIVFKSDYSFLGSFENNNVKITNDNEWIETGDIGYILNGKLFITGRKARFAKIGGIKISLDEIEIFLNEIFNQNELACIRKDNGNDTDDIYCIIVSRFSNEELKSKFVNYCLKNNKYPKWRIAIKFINCKTIPKSKNGKSNYKILEKFIK
tara:strand:+ start:903 stop:2264 length:1362 start_codon:yes stop_codon:yes gene_type:complete